jgi:signal transduction histidine kinase/ActR/RegA family two-component response regulator
LTGFSVPFLGLFCAIALVDEHQRVTRAELAWSDPETSTGRRALSVRRIIEPAIFSAIERAVATCRREVVEGPLADPAGVRVERLDSNREEQIPLAFRPQSMSIHPLVGRGRTLGVLVVALAPPRERFTPTEMALAEELAGRVGIALDNARLYLQVRDNDRRKDEFLAMLAHELRSPLAPIRNAIEVLRMGGSAERLPWARDVIDRQSRQLMRIVDDLLDVSRITSGKIQLKTEDIELGTVLASAVETSRPLIEERRHELTVTPPARPLHVRCDFARIAQVLANLLNNAAKYTPPGGRISISVTEEQRYGVIRVKDTGLGIPAPMLDGIFDLFTQLETTLDRAQGGLGIGLTLVKRLVEAQGGKVEAASAGPNQGSEFTVRLPLVTPAARSQAPLREGPKSVVAQRVLIVEDHPDTALTLSTLVSLDGHEVELARDGFAALEIAPKFRPDVALVDIGLPGMDGFEIARRLRQLECGRRCLLVAVTGYGQERDRRLALEAGFDHHLVKPVNVQLLAEVIASRQRVPEVQ